MLQQARAMGGKARGQVRAPGGGFNLSVLTGDSDLALAETIREFFARAAAKGVDLAAATSGTTLNSEDIVGTVTLNLESHLPEALNWLHLGGTHEARLSEVFGRIASEEIGQREAQEQIRALFGTSFLRSEGVARTEVAWAAEEAAMAAYIEAGIEAFVWDFGGGPCTTGICYQMHGRIVKTELIDTLGFGDFPESSGGDFPAGAAIKQPPAHPNCTCTVLPAGIEDFLDGEAQPVELGESFISFPDEPVAALSPYDATPEERMLFEQLNSPVSDVERLDGGINTTLRGTLSNGTDVIIKPSYGWHPDQAREAITPGLDHVRERSAYLVNRFLGDLVDTPEVVAGQVSGEGDATLGFSIVQTFQDSMGTIGQNLDEDYADLGRDDLRDMALFDGVIGNLDRHGGNALVDEFGHPIAIDHGLAFPEGSVESSTWGFNSRAMDALEDTEGSEGLTATHRSLLEGFRDQRDEVASTLASEGLPEEAVDDMYARVEYMLENDKYLTHYEMETDAYEAFRRL